MTINVDLGSRNPAAVDQTGVVLFVGKNMVAMASDRRDRSHIRREARRKHKRCFGSLEFRQPSFQLDMKRRSSADKRAGACAPSLTLDSGADRLLQPFVSSKAKVI